MINTLLQRGEKLAQKCQMFYIHTSFVTDGRKICGEAVNQYGGDENSEHAEECALKRCVFSKWSGQEAVLREKSLCF